MPINLNYGKIAFKIDDIEDLDEFGKLSQQVVIGGVPWQILVRSETSEKTDYVRSLSVSLSCNKESQSHSWECTVLEEWKLVNQTDPLASYFMRRNNVYRANRTKIEDNKFIKWNELIRPQNNYVKHGSIIIELEITVTSNNAEVEREREEEERKTGEICHTFENISELGDIYAYSYIVNIGGLPWRIKIRSETSEKTNYVKHLGVHVSCNWENKNPTWLCMAKVEWNLMNQYPSKSNISKTAIDEYNAERDTWGYSQFLPWKELMNPQNGFVRDDSIVLKLKITILQCFGVIEKEEENIFKNVPGAQTTGTIRHTFDNISRMGPNGLHSKVETIGGVPWKVEIRAKTKKSFLAARTEYLAVYVHCNWEDNSPLWLCKTEESRVIVHSEGSGGRSNGNDRGRSARWQDPEGDGTGSSYVGSHSYTYNAENTFNGRNILGWSELIDPNNGYVKDDKITIEIRISIKSLVGFLPVQRFDFQTFEPEFSNATVVVKNRKFYVIKELLSMSSPYFREEFARLESVENPKLTIDNANPDEFREMLSVIYPSRKGVNDRNVGYLLKLAQQFRIPSLGRLCLHYLMSPKSGKVPYITKLLYADTYKLSNLQTHCINTMKPQELRSLLDKSAFSELCNSTQQHLENKIRLLDD